MSTIEIDGVTLDYEDSGGTGPTLVLLHGVLMDSSVWEPVAAELPEYRCICPTMPLGSHRYPVPLDQPLSNESLTRLIAAFLARLDVTEVTLVLNDWGGAQIIVELGLTDRVSRLALVSCEAFDNVPPGQPGRMLVRLARTPGGLAAQAQLGRLKVARRRLAASMAAQPVDDEVVRQWLTPLRNPRIRADLRRFLSHFPTRADRDWSTGLRDFHGPALIAWGAEDRLMPAEHANRLANLLPDARMVRIEDAATLVPLDRPAILAEHLRGLVEIS